MNTTKKLLLSAAMAAPAVLLGTQAFAQSTNVAIADPEAAIANSKVWAGAQTDVATTYKTQLDQAKARSDAISAELAPLYKRFDTNGDSQLSQQEIEAARARKAPELAQIEAKEKAAQEELGRITLQPSRARAYAAEQISGKVNEAVANVVKTRRVTLLLRPNAAFFADPTADITPAITAELDRLYPKASITPPANWVPGQQAQRPVATGAAPAAAATTPAATPAKKGEKPR